MKTINELDKSLGTIYAALQQHAKKARAEWDFERLSAIEKAMERISEAQEELIKGGLE